MNKFKTMALFMRSLNLIVILATLAFIFLPIKWYHDKAPLETNVFLSLNDASNYDWVIKHEKLEILDDIENADLLILSDGDSFSQETLESIKHEVVLYDHLFSTLNEVTYKQELLTSVTGIDYLGYSGKTYSNLENTNDIPAKLIENYEKNTGNIWNFEGEGIVINNLDEVFVLLKDIDYTSPITLESGSHTIPYWGIFEFTNSTGFAESIADFNFHLTKRGQNRFKGYNLPEQFTAFYESKQPLYTAYYAAGDFSSFETKVPYNHELLPKILAHKGLYELYMQEQSYWQWFYPLMSHILHDPSAYLAAESESAADYFYIESGTIYLRETNEPFFIKGINLGAATPNKSFTEFPMDKSQYLSWFRDIAEMNVNTIRVYTLLPPVFYEALYEFNDGRDQPLYLLQEIWPEENPDNGDYLADEYNTVYHQEIIYAVNAIHGNENIPERLYRAYGLYQYDVSPYLLGFLVGRELEPEEVASTNELNEGYHFSGDFLEGGADASPTENWLASACDYAMGIAESYGSSPLVGIVNWPTLDPIDHTSEWDQTESGIEPYNDREIVDINHIDVTTGKNTFFFGAYHIYPNYPDFMNNDEAYNRYYDSEGRFRYGGYLNEFIKQHTKYPAVVAEYGLSTSMYTAHFSPDGYDHGGLDETAQAEGIIRMTKAIINEGYAGAIIFEWMDEWSKKTWTTEPYMIPYGLNPYWHNIMDPEQNYGILSYSSPTDSSGKTAYRASEDSDPIKRISTTQDAESVYIYIELSDNEIPSDDFTLKISTPTEDGLEDYWEFILEFANNTETLFIGDTPDTSVDENSIDIALETSEMAEITPSMPKAEMRVNPGYNWLSGRYRAIAAPSVDYEPYLQLVNGENTTINGTYTPTLYEDLGEISIGNLVIQQNQLDFDDHQIKLRLPYGLLGISSPTTLQILADDQVIIPTLQDQIATKTAESISFEFDRGENVYEFSMALMPWTEAITYPKLKSSYQIIANYFDTIK